RPSLATLFPYTTLFRSAGNEPAASPRISTVPPIRPGHAAGFTSGAGPGLAVGAGEGNSGALPFLRERVVGRGVPSGSCRRAWEPSAAPCRGRSVLLPLVPRSTSIRLEAQSWRARPAPNPAAPRSVHRA